eukprot:TRINITY_DN7155_c0_g2_i1.p1 TRINITY_DN7155_c0_g2~~TRINITY_DN7155_c0_g2_i1.p1  ORF type:complete len:561 (-),score=108.72 TRINITY_DN7155_c0_g2_i1:217-1899(-)
MAKVMLFVLIITSLLTLCCTQQTVLDSNDLLVMVEEPSPPDKNYAMNNTQRYEGRVTPLVEDGAVYDEDGGVMIWREGPFVYVNLTVDICRYSEHISFNTRCYNGRFLGPTITVMQGDLLTVYLTNNLGPETSEKEWNQIGWPNHTSLHFHGLHASPDEDNSFREVGPGENATIVIHISDDHYPGTHWYHAHYHGSSVYQIQGGLHGAFIIEPSDPDTFYPAFLKDMREIVLVMSNLRMFAWDNEDYRGQMEYYEIINDEVEIDLDIDYSQHNNTIVINGKYQPFIDIAVGEWTWLRLINAGTAMILPLKFNSTKCEHHAIAVDGVFLDEPMEMFTYYVFPGSRVDIAVRCSEYGNHSVQYWKDPDNFWIYRGVDSGDNDLIFTLEADRMHAGTSLPLSEYRAPDKPDYLYDLRQIPTEEIVARHTISSDFLDDNIGFNGSPWGGSGNTVLFPMEVDKVYELTFVTDLFVHPIHIHINHMQVINDTESDWSHFETHALHSVGTWRDTVYSVYERNVTVRVRPTKFTGLALVHCHYVLHADRGMMAEIEIVGPAEGTTPSL